jgi:hypothetical protein
VPTGFDPAHPRAELLKHSGLFVYREWPLPATARSAKLVGWCADRYEPMAPVHAWLLALHAPGA